MGGRIGLLLVGCVVLTSGCAMSPSGSKGPVVDGLEATPRPYEHDIPLPEGFKLDDKRSEDWSSGGLRYIRHCYVGPGEAYIVRKFYREQMPLVRWTPTNERSVDGRHVLRYKRGSEACTVTIEQAPVRGAYWAEVEVFIAPTGRGVEKTIR